MFPFGMFTVNIVALAGGVGGPSAKGVAKMYEDVLDSIVIDTVDARLAEAIEGLGVGVAVTDTLIKDVGSAVSLAARVIRAS